MSRGMTTALFVSVSLGFQTLAAYAQVGSGWTQYSPSRTIQKVGAGAYYSNSGGVETFKTRSGDERCEARVNDDYYSGQRQFQGEIKYLGGDDVVVTQIFGGETGNHAWQTRVFKQNGGELRGYTSRFLTSGVYNAWVRVNTVHNYPSNKVTAYINGSNKGTWPGDDPSGVGAKHYHKYGVYMNSQTNPYVQWRSVRFYKK
jgi:hypothetical protein